MRAERTNTVERKVIKVRELVPVDFREIEVAYPRSYVVHLGEAFPSDWIIVKQRVAVDHKVIEVLTLFPEVDTTIPIPSPSLPPVTPATPLPPPQPALPEPEID